MSALGEKFLRRYRSLMNIPRLMRLKASRKIMQMHYEDAVSVMEGKLDYAATSIFIPSEILTALGQAFIPVEQFGATVYQILGADKTYKNVIDDMKTEHLERRNVCSIAPALLGLFHHQILPAPKFVLVSSHQCDDSLKCMELLARKYDIRMLTLDIPFEENDDTLTYLTDQLSELVKLISTETRTDLSAEKLRASIRTANAVHAYRHKINHLAATNERLLRMVDMIHLYPLYTKISDERTLEIYQCLYEELSESVQNTSGPNSTQPRRVLWLGAIPLTNAGFLSYIENDLDLRVVKAEMMHHADCDPMDAQDPLRSLAKKLMGFHTVGCMDKRTDRISSWIDAYNVQGVVHFSHLACRDFNAGVGFIKDLCLQRDLPFVELQADAGDRSNFPIENLKTRMQAFSEIMKSSGAPN